MALLNRDALLNKAVLNKKRVDLETNDSTEIDFVYVREMTGREKDTFEKSILVEKRDDKGDIIGFDRDIKDFRAKLAVCTLCDEDGELIFKSSDVDQLSCQMSARNLEKINEVANEINAVTPKRKEEIEKNSDADLDGNSTSGLLKN